MKEEVDDFANDKEIQRIRKLQKEYQEMIGECSSIICRELDLQPDIYADIETFMMFQALKDAEPLDSFGSEQSGLQITYVEYYTSMSAGRVHSSGSDLYIFGRLSLSKEYPYTCIYPETFGEKIANWFTKSDVDFKEHKKFSRKFHLITKDKEKLAVLLLNKHLDDLAAFPEMELEINGNSCLFRVSKNPASPEEAEKLAQLAKKVRQVLA